MELLRKPPLFVLLVGILATGSLLVMMRASAQAQVPRPQVDVLSEASPEVAQDTLPDVEINIDEIVASGFTLPVQVTHAGDGSSRLFVVQQNGYIRIVKNGVVNPTHFLNIRSAISCCGEMGLLGLAFHPDYETNGYFYIYYTRVEDFASVIQRYSVSSSDPDQADPTSGLTILTITQPYQNHNGGQLFFGPDDGYLYIGLGDGGSGGDPHNHSQNINTLLGSMLRLDVDSASPYAIPPDNPYVGVAGLDEIWAIGLRNPWRWSFDRLTHDLYIADVGQNLWEEIDYLPAGAPGGTNFGWRCKEGNHIYDFGDDCPTAVLTDPIAEYHHTVGRSVTGGFVYRGLAYPALVGRYFYADYVEGLIWSLYQSSPGVWTVPELELDSGLNISAFGEDEYGELYVVDFGGNIRRLADANGLTINLSNSTKQVSTPSADPGEVVSYTLTLSNTGGLVDRPVSVSDMLPEGLSYVPGSLWASHGSWDDSGAPALSWNGNLDAASQISITYQATVSGVITGSLVNQASVLAPPDISMTLAASLSVPRGVLETTHEDFFVPGSQPGALSDDIPTAADCDICHSEPIFDRWRGSMMSQAARDPLMWAALHVANIDAPGAGEYCLRCHTPKGWLGGRSQPPDGSSLNPDDLADGVSCALCHRLVDPLPSTQDEAAAIDQVIRAALSHPPGDLVGSAALIIDPFDRRRGPFSFNLSLPYHSAYQTDLLRQTGDAVTRSRMCGACHNVSNPVLSWDEGLGQYWPNSMGAPAPDFDGEALFPVETTFDEWLYSDFARGGVYNPVFAGEKPDGIVRTCQDCHMRRASGIAADPAFNPVTRDCQTSGCLPVHTFVGGNAWVPQILQDPAWRLDAAGQGGYLDAATSAAQSMLRKSATLSVTLQTSPSAKVATVRVTNHGGHKLPTGYPEGRQMWLNVRAYNAAGELIFEDGAYDPASGALDRPNTTKIYEVKQGLSPELAAFLPQAAGESFHFVLNNMTVKDNRIPPQGYTQALYDRPGLRPVGAVYADGQYWDETAYTLPLETERVVATLYYQTASKEYIDFLAANGGVDGLALKGLWESSKSPPQIIDEAWLPDFEVYFPLISASE